MSLTLAFDVYGTLINPHGVVAELQSMVGEQAKAFSVTWRDKQLEYSFRRGLMQHYQPFSVCTRHALDYTCSFYHIDLSIGQRNHLIECYRELPAFDDVEHSLKTLRDSDCRLFAFSNGTAEAVEHLLVTAGIQDYFHGVVSVDDIKSFKPNPAVYAHFLRESKAKGSEACLVSSNAFDVIGAVSAGMSAVWLKRTNDVVFDPWGIKPTATITDLGELDAFVKKPC